MNTRALVTIAASIAIGLVAVLVAARWVSGKASGATSKVVVAKANLDGGTRLTQELLQIVDWPVASVVKGSFSDPKALDTRVTMTSLAQGEPVLEAKLAAVGSKGGLSSVIAEGKRAITVKVNEVVGVAGFAFPGNRVDVMVNAQDELNRPMSKIVLEQILVLAVAQEVKGDETKPKVVNAVTLEVTPEQAEILDLARSVGTLSLVLRNQMDRASVATSGVGKSDLLEGRGTRRSPFGRDVKAPEAIPAEPVVLPFMPRHERAAPRPARGIEVIRGVSRSGDPQAIPSLPPG